MKGFAPSLRTGAAGVLLVCSIGIVSIIAIAITGEAHAAVTNTPAPATSGGSEQLYQDFAQKVEKMVNTGKTQPLAALINADALLDRALKGLGGSEEARKGFRNGFTEGFSKEISGTYKSLSSFRLLRISSTNGEHLLLYRALGKSGVNYHTLVVKPNRNGRLQIVDLEFAITGEPISTTVRRIALPMLAHSEMNFLERLTSSDSDAVKYQDTVLELIATTKKGDWQKALALYRKLPPSLQREKFILLQRLKAAREVGEAEYQKAIEFWEKSHSNDASLALISIDGYALRKQHAKVIETVDRLEKLVGRDPYLDVLRSSQYLLLDQREDATRAAKAALKDEPTLAEAYDCLLAIALKEKDYSKLAEVLTETETKLGVSLVKPIEGLDEYSDFRKTDTYQTWKASHASSDPGTE